MNKKIKSLSLIELVKSKTYPLNSKINNDTNFHFNYNLINEMPSIIENIVEIANNPKTTLKESKEPKKIETALRIDSSDLKETMMRGKYWKEKNKEILPEYIYSSEFDVNYNTYENRFILTLINKISLFINSELKRFYLQILTIKNNYQLKNDYFTSLSDIGKLSNLSSIKYSLNKSFKKRSFLTFENVENKKTLVNLLEIRKNLSNLCLTNFFKNIAKLPPLQENSIYPTNILRDNHLYSSCYSFYLKLMKQNDKKLINNFNSLDFYFNYICYDLLKCLSKLDFKFRNKKITYKKKRFDIERIKGENKEFIVTFSSNKNHIDLFFKLKMKNKKIIKVKNIDKKILNRISLDLIFDKDSVLTPEYVENQVNKRILKGYNNAFVITANKEINSNDIIYCSPYEKRIDRNILNMLKSTMLITEGDSYIYTKLCPICASSITLEEENGNFNCPLCGSSFAIIKAKTKKLSFDIIWIKRLKS